MIAQVPTPSTPSGVPVWAWVLVALGGAIITAIATYFIARRTSSGRIDTTEAATLWEEARSVRQELRDEVVGLRTEVKDLNTKIDGLEEKNAQCQREADRLKVKLELLEEQVTTIKHRRDR